MEIIREVHCKVMKGLGPEFIDKTITIGLDDIEPGTPDYVIIDMIRMDVKEQLRMAGITHFTIEDIDSI